MVGGARIAGLPFLHLDDAGLVMNFGLGETEIQGSFSTPFCRMYAVSVVVGWKDFAALLSQVL